MAMEYEVVSAVGVCWKDGRIEIEVARSDDNPPFKFSLSPGSASNLARAIYACLLKAVN